MEAPVGKIDLVGRHPQFRLFQDQELAVRFLGDAVSLARMLYGYGGRRGASTLVPIDDAIVDRIALEFGRPGTAQAVARYFVENPITDPAFWARSTGLYGRMNFPVLLLQADSDANQPREFFDDAESYFPDARLLFVPGTGHFLQLERPDAVNAIVREFLAGGDPGIPGE